MSQYRISQLIMDYETPCYSYNEELRNYRKVKEVPDGNKTKYLTWIDDTKNIKSIATPEGRELTPEELFDFVI